MQLSMFDANKYKVQMMIIIIMDNHRKLDANHKKIQERLDQLNKLLEMSDCGNPANLCKLKLTLRQMMMF